MRERVQRKEQIRQSGAKARGKARMKKRGKSVKQNAQKGGRQMCRYSAAAAREGADKNGRPGRMLRTQRTGASRKAQGRYGAKKKPALREMSGDQDDSKEDNVCRPFQTADWSNPFRRRRRPF